jgi:hypothetical protein
MHTAEGCQSLILTTLDSQQEIADTSKLTLNGTTVDGNLVLGALKSLASREVGEGADQRVDGL